MRTFAGVVIVRETVANLLAHRILSGLLASVGIIAPCLALVLAISEVNGIAAREQELVDRGATVFSITAVDREPLSASRCDALNGIGGVIAAGGIVGVESLHALLPDYRFLPLASATPGLARIYWPESAARGTGVTVGAGTASDFGLVAGSLLAVSGGEDARYLPVADAAAPSPRSEAYDLALLEAVAPAGGTYECLVEGRPGAGRDLEAALVGWFPGVPTSIHPYFSLPDTGRTPAAEMRDRLSFWLPLAAAGLVTAALLTWWMMRRPELALYAVLGLNRNALLLMLVVDWAVLAVLPGSIGITVASVVSSGLINGVPVPAAAVLDIGRYLVALVPIPVLGYLALARVSAFDSLKGR